MFKPSLVGRLLKTRRYHTLTAPHSFITFFQDVPVSGKLVPPLPETPKAPAPFSRRLAQERGAFKRRKAVIMTTFLKKTLASAYFPTQEYAVSWAMKSLTAEFGMGSGIPSSLWTPRKYVNV